MVKVAIVYFSGYGHTAKMAESVREGAASIADVAVRVYRINERGDVPHGALEESGEVNAVIYGSPTYMGGPAWQFKKFADASSKQWVEQNWKNKLAAGFTNSASVNGDKYAMIQYFWTLSQQHGQLWIGTGLLPSNRKENGPADVNWSAGFAGALAISPADALPDEAPGQATWRLQSSSARGWRNLPLTFRRHEPIVTSGCG